MALSLYAPAKAEMTPIDQMPAGVYKIDPHHASVLWKVNHLGLSDYLGAFHKMDATLTLDPKDITNSKLVASVDLTSVKVDIATTSDKKDKKNSMAFEKELEGPKWLNSSKFPKATFVSTQIVKTGDDTGTIEGNLTFMGMTKPLTLKAKLNGSVAAHMILKKPVLGITATGTIKRSEWGVKEYLGAVGDDVELTINAEFVNSK